MIAVVERTVQLLAGLDLMPGSSLRLTDRAARRIADLLLPVYRDVIAEAKAEGREEARADRDALLDVLGALDRLGLEGLNDDGQGGRTYAGAVAYAPPTLFALRDAARRARRHLDRSS